MKYEYIGEQSITLHGNGEAGARMSDLPPMPEVAETAAGYKASFVRDFAREYARQAVRDERAAWMARIASCLCAAGIPTDDASVLAAAIRRGSV